MKVKILCFTGLVIFCFLSCFPLNKNSKNLENDLKKSSIPIIGISTDTENDNAFIETLHNTLKQESEGRAKVIFKNSENKQSMQDLSIDEFLNDNVDVLIVNIVDEESADLLVDKARSNSLPLVFINRDPGPDILEDWDKVYCTGSQPSESGRMSAEIILSYFKDNQNADFNNDGIIQYIVLKGEPGHRDTLLRTKAYSDAFFNSGQKGGYFGEELATEIAMFDQEIGYQKTKLLLQKFSGRIEAILANNDSMAVGAVQALKEIGYNNKKSSSYYGKESYDSRQGKKKIQNYIPVVGVNGSPDAVNAIYRGGLLGTVFNSAYSQALDALNIAIGLVNGTDPGDELSVPLTDHLGNIPGRCAWVPQQKVTAGNYQNFQQQKRSL